MRAPHMRKSLLSVGFYLFFPTILECVFILFYYFTGERMRSENLVEVSELVDDKQEQTQT